FLLHFESVDFRIDAFYPVSDFDRGNALLHEGILVAANEKILFRHGIGSEGITDSFRRRLHLLFQTRVLDAQNDQVLHVVVQTGRTVDVDVRSNRASRDGGKVREVIGTQQAHLFTGNKDEQDGAARSCGQGGGAARDFDQARNSAGIVESAVANVVAIHRRADSEMIDVRGVGDVLV